MRAKRLTTDQMIAVNAAEGAVNEAYEGWQSATLPTVAHIHPKEKKLYDAVRRWWAVLKDTTADKAAGPAEDEKATTLHFGVALAEVQRLAGCDGATTEAAKALGITLAGFKAAGGMDFDLRALRKAGVR